MIGPYPDSKLEFAGTANFRFAWPAVQAGGPPRLHRSRVGLTRSSWFHDLSASSELEWHVRIASEPIRAQVPNRTKHYTETLIVQMPAKRTAIGCS